MHDLDRAQLRDVAERYADSFTQNAPRGPRKLSLEAAQTAVATAQTRLNRIDELLDNNQRESWQARRRTRDLQTLVNARRENDSKRVVDALIDGKTDDEPSLNHLEQQLADATRAYNELRDLISKLETERQAASRELTNCEIDLTSAIADHLQHADEVEALFQYYHQLRSALAECHAACKVVDSSFGVPERHRFYDTVFEGPFSVELAGKWQSAIAELKKDPATKLPSVDDE